MKLLRISLIVLILFCFLMASGRDTILTEHSLLNINNWQYFQAQNGQVYRDGDMLGGGFFPIPASNTIYSDGILYGGYVNDPDPSKPKLRVGGYTYRTNMQPGNIYNPEDKQYIGMFRYRKDLPNLPDAYLIREAMDYFQIKEYEVGKCEKQSIFNTYVYNRNNWPEIAPFYDRNRNGKWDVDYDDPGIMDADQLMWCCTNDMDDSTAMSFYESPSIGIELHTTMWAYRHSKGILANTIFKKYKLINKSGFRIDSVFVGHFVDCDINYYGNDLGGCDSALGFGYIYNDDIKDSGYDNVAPAVGYVMLQGPVVPSAGDEAIFNFETIEDHKNLPMTSMVVKSTGVGWSDPIIGDYGGTIMAYHLLNGNAPIRYNEDTIIPFRKYNRENGKPTKFVCHGNPVTGEGDIDGKFNNMDPGDRRLYMGCGPFTMEPEDIQEVVFAIVGGIGENNIESVAKLYESVPVLYDFYKSLTEWQEPTGKAQEIDPVESDLGISEFILGHSYPNPFNSQVNIRFILYGDMEMELSIFNLQGKLVKNIYQGHTRAGDYLFDWDGRSNSGKIQPAGVYLAVLKSGPKIQTRKIVYLK